LAFGSAVKARSPPVEAAELARARCPDGAPGWECFAVRWLAAGVVVTGDGLVVDAVDLGFAGLVGLMDGTVNMSDGNLNVPDGSLVAPEGTVNMPEGTLEVLGGTVDVPDATVDVVGGTGDMVDGTVDAIDGIVDVGGTVDVDPDCTGDVIATLDVSGAVVVGRTVGAGVVGWPGPETEGTVVVPVWDETVSFTRYVYCSAAPARVVPGPKARVTTIRLAANRVLSGPSASLVSLPGDKTERICIASRSFRHSGVINCLKDEAHFVNIRERRKYGSLNTSLRR
jgi:hypothetical protein